MDNKNVYEKARHALQLWQTKLKENLLTPDSGLMHTFEVIHQGDSDFIKQLSQFGAIVANELEPVVAENNLDANLPTLQQYNAIGLRQDQVIHHPSYTKAGDIIYGSGLMAFLKKPGSMLKTLSLFLLSSHAGEAGHNCPIACSAGLLRILYQQANFPDKDVCIEKLCLPSFSENITGAQFLTEVQGGSDVGANVTKAYLDEEKEWRIDGEKWFCSNANAELILMTARFDPEITGTKGLGLFLVPSKLPNGKQNHYKIRRLKQKIGTRSMATGEVDFEGALAYPMGQLEQGIHLVMENVLHLSRIFNAFSVLGMARRAYQIAYFYAKNRSAFERQIINFPLVQETLARIKADYTAMIASSFYMVQLQDTHDRTATKEQSKADKLLLRTLANTNKYFTAKYSVENIHHCIDILAGNGTIETFSSLPRLLRDCIVCENWEGTHFVLWMQVLRDIHKFQVDVLFLKHVESLLQKIDASSRHKALFQSQIDELRKAFERLKQTDMEEQTLRFQSIIKSMGMLLAALTLALELQSGKPPESKKAALDLFIIEHLKSQNTLDFKGYQALLSRVVMP